MENLLELLNEYRTEKLRREMYVNGADKEAIELSEAERINEYEVSQTLDSQNYLKSFVKWLVDNDKVDTECQKVLHTVGAKAEGIGLECQWYSDYESLLMLLSISDEPISFLCSVLK